VYNKTLKKITPKTVKMEINYVIEFVVILLAYLILLNKAPRPNAKVSPKEIT